MKTLRFRLFIICFLAIFIPMIISNIFLTRYFQNYLTKETTLLTESAIELLKDNVNTYYNELKYFINSSFLQEEYVTALSYRSNQFFHEESDYTRSQIERTIENMLTGFLIGNRKDVDHCFLINTDGTGYLATKTKFSRIKDTTSYWSQDWYQNTINSNGRLYPIGNDIAHKMPIVNQSNHFLFAKLLYEPISQKSTSVLVVSFNNQTIKRILSDVHFNVGSIVILTDSNDQIIYSNSEVNTTLLDELELGETNIHTTSDTYTVLKETISPTNWNLYVLLSKTQLQNKMTTLYFFNLIYALGIIVLSALLFLLLSQHITYPIVHITSIIKKIETGDLLARCNIKNKNEISMIGNKLDQMLDELNNYIDKEYKAEIIRKSMEYLALQSQINPHFLFNTLNGFIALNRLGKQNELEQALYNLTLMMRYTLNQKENIVPLENEMTFLHSYCELQALRFGDKIQYKLNYDSALTDFPIPRMLLQPLVENAFIHGLEHISRNGLIQITAFIKEEYIYIIISDNGNGFHPSVLDSEKSVGIYNVKERLKYTYPKSVFQIESMQNMGTTITITIPGGNYNENSYSR